MPEKHRKRKKMTPADCRDLEVRIGFIEGIVRRDPGYVDALQLLGDHYTQRGRYSEGLEVDDVPDAGIVSHERQIGTTGVVVDPRLYLAFAISGAVQHTAGLGHPDHVISVNTDPHCPMMAMADLAIVADADATVSALSARMATRTGDPVHG